MPADKKDQKFSGSGTLTEHDSGLFQPDNIHSIACMEKFKPVKWKDDEGKFGVSLAK